MLFVTGTRPLSSSLLLTYAFAFAVGCSSTPPTTTPSEPPPAATPDPIADTPPAPPADPISFAKSGSLHVARALHSATVLLDGRVLVVGGETSDRKSIASAELYDPVSKTWKNAATLPQPRLHHTATLLASGEVLVVGGGDGSEISLPTGTNTLASALLYDPVKDTWRETGSLAQKRAGHRAVVLADGRVLIAGGGDEVGYDCAAVHPNCTVATSLASAEIYDPKAGTFSTTGAMTQARLAFTLTRLASGRVVAIAGAAKNASLKDVDLYDPATGTWSKGPDLAVDRLYHGATMLDDGRVLVLGGKIANVMPLKSEELFDEKTLTFAKAPEIGEARTGPGLLTLKSGHALLVAGNDQLGNASLADAAIFDGAAGKWAKIGSIADGRFSHTLSLLVDGSVLVVGGRDDTDEVLSSVERSVAPAE